MCISRVRVVHDGTNVVAYDQHHTAVETDVGHGFGEVATATGAATPQGNTGYGQYVFNFTQNVPYNFGAVTQELFEIYDRSMFNTSSVRNVYSPDVATATELMVDQVAAAMKKDPLAFRIEFD
jgi:isoquinoline 1-oxidoreductase beta subunit